jgi:hypothetical protein
MTNGRHDDADTNPVFEELARLRAQAFAPPKRRWWPLLLAVCTMVIGGWFIKHQIDRQDRLRDQVALRDQLDARAAELQRQIEARRNRPDPAPVAARDDGRADEPVADEPVADEPPAPEPTSRPRPPSPPRPPVEPDTPGDGRIVLDCDISSPLGCME